MPKTTPYEHALSDTERERLNLPKHCECGGRMIYDYDFGRVWSVCDTCTPVVTVTPPSYNYG